MKIIRRALAPLLSLMLAFPASAEKLSRDAISAYLNGLGSVTTDFRQINADGSLSTGKLYIKRPGRVRFEYAPPDKTLVLASRNAVAIFDAKSNQPPEQYPLKKTPLNLILGRDINLAANRMVVDHGEEGPVTYVTAQDPEHPEYGTIRLMFAADPIALRQWIITDEAGYQTTVVLDDMDTQTDIPERLFSLEDELTRRGVR